MRLGRTCMLWSFPASVMPQRGLAVIIWSLKCRDRCVTESGCPSLPAFWGWESNASYVPSSQTQAFLPGDISSHGSWPFLMMWRKAADEKLSPGLSPSPLGAISSFCVHTRSSCVLFIYLNKASFLCPTSWATSRKFASSSLLGSWDLSQNLLSHLF